MVLFVAILFFFMISGNCVVIETITANSYTDDPPGVFQWAKGWECTENVWKHYLSIF